MMKSPTAAEEMRAVEINRFFLIYGESGNVGKHILLQMKLCIGNGFASAKSTTSAAVAIKEEFDLMSDKL